MKKIIVLILFSTSIFSAKSQSIAQIKKILDTTSNPIGYVKYVLKKKFYIDTVAVYSTDQFLGKADSIAYKGKIGKVYGPFKKDNILVKVLSKAPNTFYHIKHILLDTSVFDKSFAESLADTIIKRIINGNSTFEAQAGIYSGDYQSAAKGGDLGWFVKGVMLPQLDKEMVKHKKGDLFKVWSPSGLHIVSIADNPKEDTGFALVLRVIL
ncbi:MAG: peptidyl-prolyl cis-trans isomerase [Ferruginibacter sp.]|nr:peptidyl-prolyl cis-trans isomerase [Ferruginibacter sp.]